MATKRDSGMFAERRAKRTSGNDPGPSSGEWKMLLKKGNTGLPQACQAKAHHHPPVRRPPSTPPQPSARSRSKIIEAPDEGKTKIARHNPPAAQTNVSFNPTAAPKRSPAAP